MVAYVRHNGVAKAAAASVIDQKTGRPITYWTFRQHLREMRQELGFESDLEWVMFYADELLPARRRRAPRREPCPGQLELVA
jgi:hypothetical protein